MIILVFACMPHLARAAASSNELSGVDLISIAERIYSPVGIGLPSGLRLLKRIDDQQSGLYAEIYIAQTKQVDEENNLIVAIRGVERDKIFNSPKDFLIDVKSATKGGLPQWIALRDPLLDALDGARNPKVTLVGHSMGGWSPSLLRHTSRNSVRTER